MVFHYISLVQAYHTGREEEKRKCQDDHSPRGVDSHMKRTWELAVPFRG